MSDKTQISWSDATWNVVTGCTRISDGCLNCYIERTPPFRMAGRRFDLPIIGGSTGVELHPERLTIPGRWRKPRRVFVCSLADLFHDDVPDDYIARVFWVMGAARSHTFQVLTKRPARMRSLLNSAAFVATMLQFRNAAHSAFRIDRTEAERMADRWMANPELWPLPNVWVGVSVESQQWADIRIPQLLDTAAAVRWLSCEPLLGPVDLRAWLAPSLLCLDSCRGKPTGSRPECSVACRQLAGTLGTIDWVVTGGESGKGARPAHPGWFRALRDQCENAGIAYHHKQHGEWTWQAAGGDPSGTGRDPWADREPDGYVSIDGPAVHGPVVDEETAITAGGSWSGVWRVGKKAAGRELDGAVHDNYPEVSRG